MNTSEIRYCVGTDTSRGAAPGRVHVLRDIGRGPLTTTAVACDHETAEMIARVLNDYNALRADLDACVTLLDIIRCNASVIPDPEMNGLTDCYRVPLDDIDAIAPDGAGIAEQRANAALIVRAVNAHDAMREALRMMSADTIAARIRAMALDPSARCEQYAMLLGEIGTAARAALAQADTDRSTAT